MGKFKFRIGDLIVSEQGTIAVIHYIGKNMNGNKAIYLMVSKKQEVPDVLPYAIIDVKLSEDIKACRYRYYPIIK